MAVSTIRPARQNAAVLQNLGLLAELAGTWHGTGFNLVARPDFEDQTNTFLELNLTNETTVFSPISSSIPNRGFAQTDIELFGLTYLVQISDATTGGALHIEPGIWVTQPPTSEPLLSPPEGGQLVTRMANIPHGNSLLAQGIATPFDGPPTLSPGATPISGGNPAFSIFPSFNTTAIDLQPALTAGVPLGAPIFSAGTSEAQSKPLGGFHQYNLSLPIGPPDPTNTRTPLGNVPQILPPAITQQLLNDPVTLLQQTVQEQLAQGYSFSGAALNISTATGITFFNAPVINGSPLPTTSLVTLPQAGGGIENLTFLLGPSRGSNPPNNAFTALFYATFWLEKLTHPTQPSIMQLQYVQFTILNFPALLLARPSATPPVPAPNFAWPHVQVATLQKTFG
ncbi:MAG: heme-binding protein [Stellaceae bacterium]